MVYSSLAVLALSASSVLSSAAAASPLSSFVHLHPHAKMDNRVSLTLLNRSGTFQDVKVDGHVYTVTDSRSIRIKAPVGTVVYAESSIGKHRRGEVLAELSTQLNQQTVLIK